MLIDEAGKFLSQRSFHSLSLLQVKAESKGFTVSHKLNPDLHHWFPVEPETNDFIPVSIWNDTLMGQRVNQASDNWFSQILGSSCRLVHMPLSSDRYIGEKYAVKNETVSFADSMPYTVIGQESLEDLNSRLPDPVPMNRFRPSIVFSGGTAFDEDTWENVQIGSCTFKVTKPCARCVMTTIDQNKAKKGKEPLKTLAQYRLWNKKVHFGQNLIALNIGNISLGDPVKPLKSLSAKN
jgi:uncharacterized protein YcbX